MASKNNQQARWRRKNNQQTRWRRKIANKQQPGRASKSCSINGPGLKITQYQRAGLGLAQPVQISNVYAVITGIESCACLESAHRTLARDFRPLREVAGQSSIDASHFQYIGHWPHVTAKVRSGRPIREVAELRALAVTYRFK